MSADSTNWILDIRHFTKLPEGVFVFAVVIIFQHLGQC